MLAKDSYHQSVQLIQTRKEKILTWPERVEVSREKKRKRKSVASFAFARLKYLNIAYQACSPMIGA
jgi:hypothetical protein